MFHQYARQRTQVISQDNPVIGARLIHLLFHACSWCSSSSETSDSLWWLSVSSGCEIGWSKASLYVDRVSTAPMFFNGLRFLRPIVKCQSKNCHSIILQCFWVLLKRYIHKCSDIALPWVSNSPGTNGRGVDCYSRYVNSPAIQTPVQSSRFMTV